MMPPDNSENIGKVERLKLKVEHKRLRFRVMAGACLFGIGQHDLAEQFPAMNLRNKLPEPLDLPDHIGNMTVISAPLGYVVGLETGRHLADRFTSKFGLRAVAGTAALAAGIGVAALYETKTGQRLPFITENEPDLLDAIYGAAASGAAGYFGPDVTRECSQPKLQTSPEAPKDL